MNDNDTSMVNPHHPPSKPPGSRSGCPGFFSIAGWLSGTLQLGCIYKVFTLYPEIELQCPARKPSLPS